MPRRRTRQFGRRRSTGIPMRWRSASATTRPASIGSSGSGPWPARWLSKRWRLRASILRQAEPAGRQAMPAGRQAMPAGRPMPTSCGRTPPGPRSTASRVSTPKATTMSRRRPSADCRRWRRAMPPASNRLHRYSTSRSRRRYTEATLIKALEEHGIGRPSTYAATISTILDRGYVKSRIVDSPETVGEVVTDLLVCHFGEFVDLEFTARMEDELDDVADGKLAWVPVVRAFYTPFHARIEEKTKELRRADFTTRPSDESARKVIRWSSGWVDMASSWPAPCIRNTRKHESCRDPTATAPSLRATAPMPPASRRRLRPARNAARLRWRACPATRSVRPVHGLLPLPRLRLHKEGRAATARAARL